ncbi:DUF4394 domain-containing protein [Streptomyces sp. NPDC059442]|uniref:DUF4394 domain-containing protein n=1 Tax=Streptomyces sp. NPDC059442 TaxID=3346830 RepID=UPI0036784613
MDWGTRLVDGERIDRSCSGAFSSRCRCGGRSRCCLARGARCGHDEGSPTFSSWAGDFKSGLASVGLTTDQGLVGFRFNEPSDPWTLGKINGFLGDTVLVGIDFRVQNGQLCGVGENGGIYSLNSGARAVKISQLTITLQGQHFGVDFNPAANRLRVISDTGQNLRHNIDDPAAPLTTTPDGTLTNPTTPPSIALGVTGAAYTNNDLNTATATTLFDIDTVNDRVACSFPPMPAPSHPPIAWASTKDRQLASTSTASQRLHQPRLATLRTSGKYRSYRVNIRNG